ncbi:MAG: hypothetical protein ACREQV_14365, partial [Candidatus Binatia bacterium]
RSMIFLIASSVPVDSGALQLKFVEKVTAAFVVILMKTNLQGATSRPPLHSSWIPGRALS